MGDDLEKAIALLPDYPELVAEARTLWRATGCWAVCVGETALAELAQERGFVLDQSKDWARGDYFDGQTVGRAFAERLPVLGPPISREEAEKARQELNQDAEFGLPKITRAQARRWTQEAKLG